MKRVLLTVLCVIFIIGLSGCMRFDTTMDIKSDGKADISMLYAVMNMEDEEVDTSEMDPQMDELREQGWECELYNEDNYLGFKCTKKGVELDKVAEAMQGTGDVTEMEEDGLSVTKDGKNYVIDWKVLGDEDTNEMEQYKQYFEQYGGYMQIVIKLPNKPKNHNATSTSDGGKTLTWDLLSMPAGQNIPVEFSLSALGAIIKWIIIGLVAIALIIVAIILIKKLGNKKAEGPNGGFDGPAPTGPAPDFGGQPGFDQAQQFGQQAYDQAQQFGQQAYDQAQQFGQQTYDQAQQYGQQAADAGQQYGQQAYDQAQQYGQQAYDQAQQYGQQTYDQAQQYGQQAYDQAQQYGQQAYDQVYDQAQQDSYDPNNNQ